MDSFRRATMYAALLLAVLATVSAAPQFQDGGSFNRFPPPRGTGQSGPPVYYDDEEDSSSEDELSFFQRLVRPWRWLDPVYNFFSSGNDDDDEEVYDEGNFPSRFPGQQVARLDQRPAFRPAPGQTQRYVARPPSQQLKTARSDPAVYQPAKLAAEAMHAEPERAGSQA